MICKPQQSYSHYFLAPNYLVSNMSRAILNGVFGDWHHPATQPGVRPAKLVDGGTEEEHDVEVLVAEPEVAKPPMYAVVMYNDDYTPMEFVVHILQAEFKHNTEKAVEIMLNIHHKGRGMAGIFPKDIAETKAKNANLAARKEGYPLLVQIEPHQA